MVSSHRAIHPSIQVGRGIIKTFLFQSTELEELDDQARLASPLHSSIKAAVSKSKLIKMKHQSDLLGQLFVSCVSNIF